MQLQGYVPIDITPSEAASDGKAVACPTAEHQCSATFQFNGAAGWYELDVEYFDQDNGESTFRVFVGNQP